MIKILISLILSASIGATCRFFDIPVPSPPKLLGVFMVMAITLGYMSTDWFLSRSASTKTTSSPQNKVAKK